MTETHNKHLHLVHIKKTREYHKTNLLKYNTTTHGCSFWFELFTALDQAITKAPQPHLLDQRSHDLVPDICLHHRLHQGQRRPGTAYFPLVHQRRPHRGEHQVVRKVLERRLEAGKTSRNEDWNGWWVVFGFGRGWALGGVGGGCSYSERLNGNSSNNTSPSVRVESIHI